MREVAKVSKGGEFTSRPHTFTPSTISRRRWLSGHCENAAIARPAGGYRRVRLEIAKVFASFSPETAELLKGAEFRKADQLFDKELTIDLGGVRQ